jgi:amino acid transporter
LCVRGIEISARAQNIMIVAQIGALLLFAVIALIRVWTDNGVEGSTDPALSWFNPFDLASTDALVFGVLTGIFIYWGWDSAVTVNEESTDSNGAGKAAVVSTAILVGVYLLVATACLAWLGVEALGEFEDETAFNAIAGQVFTSPLDKLVILAVLTSALAATQTTVLPSSRTALSMGRRGAAPRTLAHIHARYLTPDTATWVVGALAIGFYVVFNYASEEFYDASLAALGLLICINYGLNGLACTVYYRRELFKSAKNFAFLGLAPLVGAGILGAVFAKSVWDFRETGVEDTTYWFGLQAPLVVTIGLFVLAAGIIVGWRTTQAGRGFFARKLETADPSLLTPAPEGRA